MIVHDKVLTFATRAQRSLALLALVAVVAAVFYLIPRPSITVGYAVANGATFVLLVCMMQTTMLTSSIWFRLAIAALAAGCLASTLLPFANGFTVGPWALIKAVALFAVIAMMRHRQIAHLSRTEQLRTCP